MKNKRRINLKKVLYLIIGIYTGYILFQQQMYFVSCKKDENVYLQKINEQKKITEELKNQEINYQSDLYIENLAREKLGMVLPGEKIFIDTSK